MFRRLLLVLTVCLPVPFMLTGCGTTDTPSSLGTPELLALRPALPTAYVGEEYSGLVAVTGGVAPYRVSVVSGTLPAGLKFSGVGGATITGVPTAAGVSKLRLEVVDANLSVRSQEVTLTVQAALLLDVQPALPPTEIRGETRIPLRIVGPRGVRSLHYTWTLPEGVKVLRVGPPPEGLDTQAAKAALPFTSAKTNASGTSQGVPATTAPKPSTVTWSQQGQQLTLDFVFAQAPAGKAQIALVTVAPAAGKAFVLSTPTLGKTSQLRALDAAGAVIRDTLSEGSGGTAKQGATKLDTAKLDTAKSDTPQAAALSNPPSDKAPVTKAPASLPAVPTLQQPVTP